MFPEGFFDIMELFYFNILTFEIATCKINTSSGGLNFLSTDHKSFSCHLLTVPKSYFSMEHLKSETCRSEQKDSKRPFLFVIYLVTRSTSRATYKIPI